MITPTSGAWLAWQSPEACVLGAIEFAHGQFVSKRASHFTPSRLRIHRVWIVHQHLLVEPRGGGIDGSHHTASDLAILNFELQLPSVIPA